MKFRAVLAALLASMIIFSGCTDGNEPNANVENANNDNVTVESTGDNETQKEEEKPEAEEEEKEVELELVLTIDVKTTGYELVGGHNATIVMIPFVGSAHGDYFNGDIVGTGYDTQTIIDDVTHFFREVYDKRYRRQWSGMHSLYREQRHRSCQVRSHNLHRQCAS